MNSGKLSVDGILLIYAHSIQPNAPTIMEYINAFQKYSMFDVFPINVQFGFPRILANLQFKTIILHYSLFGNSPFKLRYPFIQYLKAAKSSYKIALFQDEHQSCVQRFSLINETAIDAIYSLLQPEHFETVYLKHTTVKHVFPALPGYVDDELIRKAARFTQSFEHRTIDVGYRSRPLPFWMGKGAQEKTDIAYKFISYSKGLGLTLDIKTNEEDRIYGDSWYRFLANCRSTIGVESGVSIFDIDGHVQTTVEEFVAKHPDMSFDEVYDRILSKWEDNIYYRSISPKIFECAALRVLMILFEGTYCGILEPMTHYIPLKKDFSNFDEVISLLRDQVLVREMTDRTYEELIGTNKYHYRTLIGHVDAHIEMLNTSFETSAGELARIDRAIRRGQAIRERAVKLRFYLARHLPMKSMFRVLYHGVKNLLMNTRRL